MPKRRFEEEENEEVRKVPILRTTYDILRKEAEAKGVTMEEVIEEKIGKEEPRTDFIKYLTENLDGNFWDRRLTRKEWFAELFFYGGLMQRLSLMNLNPMLQALHRVSETFSEGFRTGLALMPTGEDKATAAKARLMEKFSDVMGTLMETLLRFYGQQAAPKPVETRPIQEFLEEEKPKPRIPAPEVPTQPLDRYEEEGVEYEQKPEEEVEHGEEEG